MGGFKSWFFWLDTFFFHLKAAKKDCISENFELLQFCFFNVAPSIFSRCSIFTPPKSSLGLTFQSTICEPPHLFGLCLFEIMNGICQQKILPPFPLYNIANSELNRRMKGLSTSLRPLWYFIRRMLAFVCPLPVRSLLIVIKRRGTRFADVPNEFVTILCNIYISLNYLNFLV